MALLFKDTILTNNGFKISNKAALGKTQFSIFKAVSTDFDLTNYKIEDLKNLTSLPNEIESGALIDYDAPENSISVIKLSFDNSKFKQGYTVRAIGLYGKDNDENVFLHSLTVSDTPVLVPEISGNIFDGLYHSIAIFSGDNKKMNVDLQQQGTASIHYVDQSISKLNDDLIEYINKNYKTLNDKIENDIRPTLNQKANNNDFEKFKNDTNENINNIDLSKVTEDANNFTKDLVDKSHNQSSIDIENSEKRTTNLIKNQFKYFNSLDEVNNTTAPEGTIAIVKE